MSEKVTRYATPLSFELRIGMLKLHIMKKVFSVEPALHKAGYTGTAPASTRTFFAKIILSGSYRGADTPVVA
jgi:hypothetical protein